VENGDRYKLYYFVIVIIIDSGFYDVQLSGERLRYIRHRLMISALLMVITMTIYNVSDKSDAYIELVINFLGTFLLIAIFITLLLDYLNKKQQTKTKS
jgi:hypothetical protein